MKSLPIGEVLKEYGYINEEQLQIALDAQKKDRSKRLGEHLIDLGFVSEQQMLEALSDKLAEPLVSLDNIDFDINAVKKVPEAMAQKYNVIGYAFNDNVLTVATSDPLNYYGLEDVRLVSGCRISVSLATKADIQIAIERYYSDVEFRLNLNYRGYFVYYLLIGVGYLAGIFLFRCFNQWELILIPGEMMGIFYVFCKGSIYKKTDLNKEKIVIFLKAVAYLIASQLLIQIVFNSDRFILKLFSGGVAVTIYYIASLMGKTIALLSTPLNSVIIGYLAKSKEEMTVNRWIKIVVLCIFLAGTALIACIVASNFVIRILYPQEYSLAKPFFVVANLAQITYFSTGILATILLRYVEEKYQLYITVGYIFAFLAVVIPVTWMCGLEGFAYAILGVNCLRFVFVFLVMMRKIYRTKS